MSYKLQRKIIVCVFLAVPVLLLVTFTVIPFFKLLHMSFADWDGFSPSYQLVGVKNYVTTFSSPNVWISLRNNCVYILASLLQNILGLYLAVVLTKKIKGRNFFRSAIFIPYIINSVAVAFIFNYMYSYDYSPINMALVSLGQEPIKFLSDTGIVNYSLAFISLWRFLGYTIVVYIAAIESLPVDIYEASMIDGANKWQEFRYITAPGISRIISLNLFLCISGSLQAFVDPLILTKGGPGYASSTFVTYLINAAFTYNQYSLAAAMSVILIIVTVTVTVLQRRITDKLFG